MVLAKWQAMLVMLAWAGWAWGQSAPSTPLQIGSDLLTVREPGRPDQKCRILKAWKQPDGTMAFEVQCLETEEYLTLVEMARSEIGATDPTKGMKSRIYHWGQSATPPPGVPQMPAAPIPQAKDSKSATSAETSATSVAPKSDPAAAKIDDKQEPAEKPKDDSPSLEPNVSTPSGPSDKVEPKYALPEAPESKPGPISVETARPSNWHESWGKADDHRTQLPAEKISQTSPGTPASDSAMSPPGEQPSVEQKPNSGNDRQMPLPVEPATSEPASNTEKTPPATLPIMTPSDEAPVENSDSPSPSAKTEVAPQSIQPAGYAHVDDRPGIAHVTDIPPAGTKVAGESKKPVVDFLRAIWRPSLKEPAPLETVQVNAVPVTPPRPPDASQIEATLKNGLLPSHREMAAEYLSGLDRQREPTVVPALVQAASEDPAGTVRAACIHCLVKMNANTPEVVGVLMNLKSDPDLRVRREAHQALISFGLAKPEPENETIHQISAPWPVNGGW